jgi:hypothetical protein
MRIQIGQIALNKTQAYMRPCLRDYGDLFRLKVSQVCTLAWGIGDMIMIANGVDYHQCLFMLIDTAVSKHFFLKFMDWIKCQPYYIDDYVYDDIEKGRMHMIVLKIPERHQGALEKFKMGEYSQMYQMSDLNYLFDNNPDIARVIIKDHNYKVEFVNKINQLYETHISPNEFQGELDFKPKSEEEIFNYE